jgi:hypothetical protein
MTSDRSSLAIIPAVETIIAARFGGPLRLAEATDLRSSDRSNVLRLELLDGPPGAPASVIVKQAAGDEGETFDPDNQALFAPAWRLFNDWSALAFLGQVAGDLALFPALYGGDRSQGLIVLEDLGSGQGLHDLLLGADPAAAGRALLELAALLGHMHARSAGRFEGYASIRHAISGRDATSRERYDWLAPAFRDALAALALDPPSGAEEELGDVIDALNEPGPFLVFTHGDPCPDNCLYANGRLRLLDFEFGGFRHALVDGVYGRIHFPTCWCVNRLPEQIALRMEEAYRTALAAGCPAAADESMFRRAVATACASWAINAIHNLDRMLQEDRTWGIATLRQRVLLRSEIFARTTATYGHFEALGATFSSLAARLRALWTPGADALPLYPAFR